MLEASSERLDEPGARRPETRRAGPVWQKSFGLRLVRAPGTAFAGCLDLLTKPDFGRMGLSGRTLL